MPFFSGFARSIGNNLAQTRQENQRQAEAQADRENRVLQTLSQSDDPEIAAHGIAGLMDQTLQRPKKGLRGWLGEMAGNPALPKIRDLVTQGRQVVPHEPPLTFGDEGGAGGAGGSGAPGGIGAAATPPPKGGAAQVAGGATEPGAAPLSMAAVESGGIGPLGPTTQGTQRPMPSPLATVPRQVFLTPLQRAAQEQTASMTGKLEGFRQARNPTEQRLLGGAGFAPKDVSGVARSEDILADEPNALDESGKPLSDQPGGTWRGVRLPDNSIRYRPVAPPTALQAKPAIRMMAGPDGAPHLYRIGADNVKVDLGAQPVKENRVTWTDENNQVHSDPVPTVFQQSATAPPNGAAAGGHPAAPAANAPTGAPPGRLTSPVPGAPPRPAPVAATGPVPAATPPPAPGAAGPAAIAAAPAGPRASAGGGRVLGTGKQAAQQTEGAVIGPDGAPQEVTALFDPIRKKYFDPTNPQQELAGFIPGDMGKAAVQAFATGKSTIDTIDKAIAAIQASGLGKSTDPADTLKLQMQYRGGANPVTSALGSLTSLASLQGANQYVKGNSRSFQMFNRASQHTALMPTDAEAGWGTTPVVGGLVTPKNAMRTGHPPWDSPAALIEKLQTSRDITQQGLQELQKSAGKGGGRAVGGGASAATPPPAASGAAPAAGAAGMIRARDPQGQLHEAPAGTPLPAGWTLEPTVH